MIALKEKKQNKNATTNVTKCRKKSSHVFCILSLFSLRKTYLIHLIHKGLPRNTSLCLLSLLNLIGAQIHLDASELLFMVTNVFCSLLDPLLSSLPPSLTPFPHSPTSLSPSILKLRILQGPVFRGGYLHLDLVTSGMCCIHEPTAAVATGMRPA